MWPQRIASFLIAVSSGLAAACACLVAIIYVPIIMLFGRDDPNETLSAYLFAIAVPIFAALLVVVGAALSLQLLRRRRHFAAGILAVVLVAVVSFAIIRLRPH
jgi:hypothetical protein